MTSAEASRELARVTAIVRAVGRWRALWTGALPLLLLPGLVLLAASLPDLWLTRADAVLPLVLGIVALGSTAAAGLLVGRALQARRLRGRIGEVESALGLAHGDLLGALELAEPGYRDDSAGLAHLHRVQVARAAAGVEPRHLLPTSGASIGRARSLTLWGLGILTAASVATLVGQPGAIRGSIVTLARPWAGTFPPPPPPLGVRPAGGEVLRGDSFEIVVTAEGRSRVLLSQARAGTPPRKDPLRVEAGHAVGTVGPVDETIRFWVEDGDGATTDTFVVTALDPLMVTDLRIGIEHPKYLRRSAELLSGLVTDLQVPEGARLSFTARVNHPLRRGGLARASGETVDTLFFGVAGLVVSGALTPTEGARLSWWLDPEEAVPATRTPPPIQLSVMPDEPPEVRVSHPGQDRILGLERALQLVIEAGDDHGLAEVGFTWWREAADGGRDAPVYTRLAGDEVTRRLVLRPRLDLTGSELRAGDVIVYFASASDARPGARAAVSDTFRARLASTGEIRDEVARISEQWVEDTRSLQDLASDVAAEARDAERLHSRLDPSAGGGQSETERAEFGTTREARDVMRRAQELETELARVQEELRQTAGGMDASSLADPSLRHRLEELEALFQEILHSGLQDEIQAVEEALRGLDREELRDSLGGLSRRSRSVEDRLDQALGLLERVALEQRVESVRQRAEDLANALERQAGSGTRGEESPARAEELAARSEDLAGEAEELAQRLADQDLLEAAVLTGDAEREARSAAASLRDARNGSAQGGGAAAADSREGEREAAEHMARAESGLESAKESMTADWRAEAMESLERAASETLELAREQGRVIERLQAGESPESLSARQSGIREGLDNLTQALAEAGRKTALMDRRAGPAADRAGDEMDSMRRSLAGGDSRRGEAERQGEAAMDALGDLAGALISSRRAMAEASSATGMEEALQKLAAAGRSQNAVNGASGELFRFMQTGQANGDRLESLAARQEAVARELRELAGDPAAQGLGGRPGELAGEAEDIARSLESGQLDAATLVRQQRLFQRLLDAGRSLQKDDEDPDRREARSARPRVTLVPDPGDGAAGGVSFPYPDAESLESLTPTQRRLVFEYFDRLNRSAAGVVP